MNFKPSISFTWGQEPLDTRLGIMFGTQYDYVLLSDTDTPRCLRCDLVIGLVWVNLRLGLVIY